MSLRVACIGGGAMGSLFAAHIARLPNAGHVSIVSRWQTQLDAIESNGNRLRCLLADGSHEFHAPVVPLYASEEETRTLLGTDIVFVWVKGGKDTHRAVQLAKGWEPHTVCCLQNGMQHVDIVTKDFPYAVYGTTTVSAIVKTPGTVVQTSCNTPETETTVIYSANPRDCEIVSDLWKHVGLLGAVRIAQSQAQISKAIWIKLIVNAAVNPIAALCRLRNGQLLEEPAAMQVAIALAREAIQVSPAEFDLEEIDVEELLTNVLKRTQANTSSMLSDVLRGVRPVEAEAILGPILRQSLDKGIAAPVCQAMLQLLLSIDATNSDA